jgi:hypothetical protein
LPENSCAVVIVGTAANMAKRATRFNVLLDSLQ